MDSCGWVRALDSWQGSGCRFPLGKFALGVRMWKQTLSHLGSRKGSPQSGDVWPLALRSCLDDNLWQKFSVSQKTHPQSPAPLSLLLLPFQYVLMEFEVLYAHGREMKTAIEYSLECSCLAQVYNIAAKIYMAEAFHPAAFPPSCCNVLWLLACLKDFLCPLRTPTYFGDSASKVLDW